MRHRAPTLLLDRLLLHHRPRTVLAAVVLLVAGLVTASVMTASGPPDGSDAAIETPSYPGASYDPPTPSAGESSESTSGETPSQAPTSSSPTLRPTQSPVSRGGDRGTDAPSPSTSPAPSPAPGTPTPGDAPTTTDAPTPEEPAADAPQTTATTRNANAGRWVIGVAADTEATYECSLDGGPYQACGSTVTYDDLEEGTHSFAAKATDGEGNTDPSPARLTTEIDSRGQD